MNLYGFVGNAGVNRWDNLGRFFIIDDAAEIYAAAEAVGLTVAAYLATPAGQQLTRNLAAAAVAVANVARISAVCTAAAAACVSDPWIRGPGKCKRKPCSEYFGQCLNSNGVWPTDKCPL
jgi:hypothetical protein